MHIMHITVLTLFFNSLSKQYISFNFWKSLPQKKKKKKRNYAVILLDRALRRKGEKRFRGSETKL